MTKHSFQILMVLVFAALLIVSIIPPLHFSGASDDYPETARRIPSPGSDSWTEHFDWSSVYQNVSATNASGWGNDVVTARRDYDFSLLDDYDQIDDVLSMDIQDNKLYCGFFQQDYTPPYASLYILNISDPTAITQLTNWSYHGYVRAVEVDGDILYVGYHHETQMSSIALYNVSDPRSSAPIQTDNITGLNQVPWAFDVQGHFLYAACYSSFAIIDIEDPYNIKLVNETTTLRALDVDVEGHLAYLATTNGFKIVDVSNPYSPFIVGSVLVSEIADVLIDGRFAYVSADYSDRLYIFDVSNPSNPIILSSYLLVSPEKLVLQGHTLFVKGGIGDLAILDVSNPRQPLLVDELILGYGIEDMALFGGDLVTSSWGGGIHTYRVGASGGGITDLPFVGAYASTEEVLDIRVQGDIAYVAAGTDGLLTLNISDPSNPVYLDLLQAEGVSCYYRKLDIQGPIVYIADYGSLRGLRLFNVTDPTNIQYLGKYSLTEATDVAVAGEIAYVANGFAGIYILNVSHPSSITLISSISGLGNVTALWPQGHHLYAVSDRGGTYDYSFFIYNITHHDVPTRTFQAENTSSFYDIFVEGDVAFTANNQTLAFWNITNPFAADYAYEIYDIPAQVKGVWGWGPYLLATKGQPGVHLFDARYPYFPQFLSAYTNAETAQAITVHGDYAYVANRTSLVILRLFRSAASTFSTGNSIAQSLILYEGNNRPIENGTLSFQGSIPSGTSIIWELSADGGVHWETVTPGVQHTFAHQGVDFCWRAILITTRDDLSPRISQVDLIWWFNDLPSTPQLNDPGDFDEDGTFNVTWSASIDDGTIDHYQLQMSTTLDFTTILQEWTLTDTRQLVSGLVEGWYYFRVRAWDDDGEPSPYWSGTEDIRIENQPPSTPTLNDPGDIDDDGIFDVSWGASQDPEGGPVEYYLYMYETTNLENELANWGAGESTSTEVDIFDYGNGTYYFAVKARDQGGKDSGWSNVESITLAIPTPSTTPTQTSPPIPSFPFEAILLGILVAIIPVIFIRQQNRRKQ